MWGKLLFRVGQCRWALGEEFKVLRPEGQRGPPSFKDIPYMIYTSLTVVKVNSLSKGHCIPREDKLQKEPEMSVQQAKLPCFRLLGTNGVTTQLRLARPVDLQRTREFKYWKTLNLKP